MAEKDNRIHGITLMGSKREYCTKNPENKNHHIFKFAPKKYFCIHCHKEFDRDSFAIIESTLS